MISDINIDRALAWKCKLDSEIDEINELISSIKKSEELFTSCGNDPVIRAFCYANAELYNQLDDLSRDLDRLKEFLNIIIRRDSNTHQLVR